MNEDNTEGVYVKQLKIIQGDYRATHLVGFMLCFLSFFIVECDVKQQYCPFEYRLIIYVLPVISHE